MSGSAPRPQSKLAVPLAPLLPHMQLDPPALAKVEALATAEAAMTTLEAAGMLADALRVAAHGLPKREAVWWTCMCARAVPYAAAIPADLVAVEAAEAWVRRPDEAARRAAHKAAEAAGFKSTEAWAAMAVFWSGGSMSPEGQPPVPPGEHFSGMAVAGGVALAAVRQTPQHAQARMQRFLASAREIALGGAGRIQVEAVA